MAAGSEASSFRRHMERAVRLYESLEYEKALQGLDKARVLAATAEEQVSVALHRGIVLADLGRRKQALDEFRAGLTLRPEAVLPLQVAPKVQRDFESVRKQVQRKGASTKPAVTAAKVEPAPPAPEPVKPAPPPPAEASAEAPKSLPQDLRSKLGAAGSVVGERVGTAVGSVLDTVIRKDKGKDEKPSDAQAAPSAKQEP
jgi:tetratricopeptide (TPR) repeat protein